MTSVWVVGMPGGRPGYEIRVPLFTSLSERVPVIGNGQIWSSSPCISSAGQSIAATEIEFTGHATQGAISFDASSACSDSTVRAWGTQPQLNGLIPVQSPRHTGSATIAWARSCLGASATLRYVGDRFEKGLPTCPLPAVTTLDGVLTLPVAHGVLLVARPENLLDATVLTRNAGSSIDLRTPRTL